jgi:hypothetical protein
MTKPTQVSINISANIVVDEELRNRVRERYPFVECETDEDYATVALYAASDNSLPKELLWGSLKIGVRF